MNKLIKKIVESLFDDIDDIVDTPEKVVSQEVFNNEMKYLKELPCNDTEYPKGFTDFEKAEKLYKIGYLYVSSLLNQVRNTKVFQDEIKIKCRLKDYDNTLHSDLIEIYTSGHYKDKLSPLCFIYINDNNIKLFKLFESPYYVYLSDSMKKLNMNIYYLINVYLNKGFNIQNIVINLNGLRVAKPNVYKDIIITGCSQNYDDLVPIKSEYIDTYKKILIQYGADEVKPMNKVFKTQTIIFYETNLFENLKAFEDFLIYLRDMKYKKYKMYKQPGMLQNTPYKDYHYGEDLFNDFIIDNNLEQYTFTKADKDEIRRIIENKLIVYLKIQKNYNVPSYGYIISCEFGDKDKDERGSFIIAKLSLDYDDEESKDHVYSKTIWKFYKSGLCELVKEIM